MNKFRFALTFYKRRRTYQVVPKMTFAICTQLLYLLTQTWSLICQMWFLFSIVFQLSKQVSFVLKQQMFCVYYFLLKGKKLLETNFFFNKMFTTRQWNTGEQQRVEKFPYFFFTAIRIIHSQTNLPKLLTKMTSKEIIWPANMKY